MMYCGSKTFIVGEYAVLQGFAGIILVHEPYFIATINSDKTTPAFHPDSPAGLYLSQQAPELNQHIEFFDPYAKKGGYGASSAEFIVAYCLAHQLTLPLSAEDAWLARAAYLDFVANASGVDVIAQTQKPGIYYIHPTNKIIEPLPWLFSQLKLVHQHTGIKTKTHEHLAQLATFDATPLHALVEQTRTALLTESYSGLIDAIAHYQQALSDLGLVHPQTQLLLEQLALNPNVFACKGCGALGSDVLLSLEGVL